VKATSLAGHVTSGKAPGPRIRPGAKFGRGSVAARLARGRRSRCSAGIHQGALGQFHSGSQALDPHASAVSRARRNHARRRARESLWRDRRHRRYRGLRTSRAGHDLVLMFRIGRQVPRRILVVVRTAVQTRRHRCRFGSGKPCRQR
jgi:hypothetical protein